MAACVGNSVEWYDFAIYGALGVLVTPVFYPSQDTATVLLAAFAVYATAFLVRPVGAVVFGVLADARGRKPVLVGVVLLMSGATAAIGVLPGYATIGVLASCGILLLRATQGLAAGGELGLAAVFITESAPDGRRGAFAAWHTATLAVGVAAGLTVGGLLHLLPPARLEAGWWRIAFLVALPLGAVGFYLRRRVAESPLFVQALRSQALEPHPVRLLWTGHRRAWLTGFAFIASGSLAFNTFFIFLPNHLIATTDLSPTAVLLVAVVGLLGGAASALVLGSLSDRVGRRPVVLVSVGLLALGAVPLLAMARSGSVGALLIADLLSGGLVGGVLSVALLAEMFPTGLRATGVALTAGLASAAVGGTAPFIDQVLFQTTGQAMAPALYVATVALLAFAALWSWPESAFGDLGRGAQTSVDDASGKSSGASGS
ncbi:MFS transporter [Nocardioides sp. LHG3406-4]|uniref:MFS transporter n=1 Tax=Nocardioides sp. LHG3406-4 TaxID=2804575 RepID=UPI003CF5CAFD